jgi:hypothetical protein
VPDLEPNTTTIYDFRRLCAFVTEHCTACQTALANQVWTEIEALVIGPGESEASKSRYSQLQQCLAAPCALRADYSYQ